MNSHPLVVVGASLAGVHVVRGAREAGFRGPIVLIGAEDHLPYDRPPLSKQHLHGDVLPPDVLLDRSVLEDDLGVRLELGRAATGLDVDEQLLFRGDEEIRYQSLVIATGSEPRRLPSAGTVSAVTCLRTYDDAQRIRRRLTPGAHIVVVGAGLIGSEVASAALARGCRATLVDVDEIPLRRVVGPEIGEAVATLQSAAGVDLRLGTGIERVAAAGEGAEVVLSDGSRLTADLVVVGIGSTPATSWLAGSGLVLEPDRSIACDSHLRAAPNVYAAGDVATWWNGSLDGRCRFENWTNAIAQGTHAGRNAAAGGPTSPYRGTPYVWTDLHGVRLQVAGQVQHCTTHVVRPGAPLSGLIAVTARSGVAVGLLCADQAAALGRGRRLLGRASLDEMVATVTKAARGGTPAATSADAAR